MESNPNNSRIGIEFGAPIDGNEKTSIKLAVNFGRGAADLQTEKLKAIIGAEDPNLSLVFVSTPVPGKSQEYEAILKGILEGQEKGGDNPQLVTGLIAQGLISYKIINSGDKSILILQPGAAVEPMIKEQVNMFLGMGVQDLADSEQAAINLNFVSAIDSYDLLDYHNKKYSTLAAFWTSSMLELTVKTVEGSKLSAKLLDLLKSIVPFLSATPLPLLQLLQSVDIDFSFRDVEELPPSLKLYFATGDDKVSTQIPRVPIGQKDSEPAQLIKKLTEVLQPDVEVYATLDKVAAVQLSIKTPGFGVMLTTPHEYIV